MHCHNNCTDSDGETAQCIQQCPLAVLVLVQWERTAQQLGQPSGEWLLDCSSSCWVWSWGGCGPAAGTNTPHNKGTTNLYTVYLGLLPLVAGREFAVLLAVHCTELQISCSTTPPTPRPPLQPLPPPTPSHQPATAPRDPEAHPPTTSLHLPLSMPTTKRERRGRGRLCTMCRRT